jgi:hypothetical protein
LTKTLAISPYFEKIFLMEALLHIDSGRDFNTNTTLSEEILRLIDLTPVAAEEVGRSS